MTIEHTIYYFGGKTIFNNLKTILKNEVYTYSKYDTLSNLNDALLNRTPDLIMVEGIENPSEFYSAIQLNADKTKETCILFLTNSEIKDLNETYVKSIPLPLNEQSFIFSVKKIVNDIYEKKFLKRNNAFLENIPLMTNLCSMNIKEHAQVESTVDFFNFLLNGDLETKEAMTHLLENAIEHGIYKIGFKLKGKLLKSGKWESELSKKRELHKSDNLFVNIRFKRTSEGLHIYIIDPGKGFNWRHYMSIEHSGSDSYNGRGIAISMNLGFDKIEYNSEGNQVKLTKSL